MENEYIGKTRNAGVVILLVIVTLGIYAFVWYYKINKEISLHDPNQDFSPGLATFALIIPIANLVSVYNTADRIKRMQKSDGEQDLISPGVALIWALLFGIGYYIYVQGALNNHWYESRKLSNENLSVLPSTPHNNEPQDAIPYIPNKKNVNFANDLWGFLKVRKKFWLLPIILTLLFFGALMVFASGSAIAPFIYTIF
jgi:hypothetical protein